MEERQKAKASQDKAAAVAKISESQRKQNQLFLHNSIISSEELREPGRAAKRTNGVTDALVELVLNLHKPGVNCYFLL